MLTNVPRTLGIFGALVAIGACSSDHHRIGTGEDTIGQDGGPATGGTSGSGGSAAGSSGSGGATAGTSGSGGISGSGGSSGSGGTGSNCLTETTCYGRCTCEGGLSTDCLQQCTGDPCAGQQLPPCAPACPGGFDIAGTSCTVGEKCTITNVGDECECGTSGTWACAIHPPLGTGCNAVCDYPTGSLRYFMTCGDPVCRSPDPDDSTVPNCTTQQEGDPCSTRDALCELPGDTCGSGLLCTDTDPTAGGCPRSLARYKTGIDYLDQAELEAIRDGLLKMRLARWHYKSEPSTARSHLGFIIDDQPSSPAVTANGERVDLYGYASMAAATIQLQQKQIEALEREMRSLREAVKKHCR